MLREQIETLLHAGEHAQGEDVDLHKSQRVDIVLVPLDDLPVLHARRFDRHEIVEPIVGQDKAAGVL